jgi:hypothetical protein
MTGTMSGSVFDKSTKAGLAGVTVSAQLITTNERFSGPETDRRGTYLISGAPPGIYTFFLNYRGTEYPVEGDLDIRTSMSFLLESCFELDTNTGATSLLEECRSGLYAETEVVTLGPHRFLLPEPIQDLQEPIQDLQEPIPADWTPDLSTVAVEHAGIECIAAGRYPILTAEIEPAENVQSSRVYFRASQHPDFYYVEMTESVDVDAFQAILPKPSPETEQIIYYIEAFDLDFNNALTPEHAPDVTEGDECDRRRPGAAYFPGDNPEIVVGATVAGASAVPIGFEAAGIAGFISSTGIVTGAVAAGAGIGGGLGTTGAVIIVAGSAAGAAGAISAATKEDEASKVR